MPHLVSGINFLVLSINLISARLSLSCLFTLLPHLTLSTHHSHSLPLSFTPTSRPTSFTNLSHDKLASNLRTDSMDFKTGPFLLSTEHLRFFTARRNAGIASGVLAIAILCLSVCPSVTRRYCVKTMACSMVQFALLDSKMCLVL